MTHLLTAALLVGGPLLVGVLFELWLLARYRVRQQGRMKQVRQRPDPRAWLDNADGWRPK